jgi:hypothetical protein
MLIRSVWCIQKRRIIIQEKKRGFVAWWALQHKRDYKPFLTKIYVTEKLNGKI